MEDVKFKRVDGQPNELLDGGGFYISYNGNPCPDIKMFKADGGGGETALCVDGEDGQVWMILNGDYRNAYISAFSGGAKSCVEVYKKHIEHRSSWSTDGIGADDILNWLTRRAENITS